MYPAKVGAQWAKKGSNQGAATRKGTRERGRDHSGLRIGLTRPPRAGGLRRGRMQGVRRRLASVAWCLVVAGLLAHAVARGQAGGAAVAAGIVVGGVAAAV